MTTYSQPLVLGIDQYAPSHHLSLADRLDLYGKNTGNFIFAEALYQVVDNSRRSSYHYTPREIENADVVVVAAANWINAHSDFGNFAKRLKSFGRPVVLVGIGVQVSGPDLEPQITSGTRLLLDLAAETSAMISVRGEQTEQVLRSWGYENVMITGCPSLLLSNGRFMTYTFRPEATPENTVLMGTRHLMERASPSQNEIYRLAYRTSTDLLLQSELADMYFVENVARNQDSTGRSNRALELSYGDSDIGSIRRYLSLHGKVFFNAQDWKAYLLNKEYVVGTRIHGIIATILSGRRGLLLNHDARTIELAKAMGIPTASIEDLNPITFEKLAEMIAETDFDLTRRKFPDYFKWFQEFCKLNGIAFRHPVKGFGE